MEVLVFGGTVEGRHIVEWLSGLGCCSVVSCTATEYGGQLIEGLDGVQTLVGPLDASAKERLMAEHDFACIVDATHPYATHVTQSIAQLGEAYGVRVLRLVRDGGGSAGFTSASSVQEAASLLAERQGNVLLTTGSKDLASFVQALPDYQERLYVRILPVLDSVAHAKELGIPASHIIAMQGPFTEELNQALLRQFDIRTMVTKASGKAGGFQEKARSAAACGVELVVIDRPEQTPGMSFACLQSALADVLGVEAPRADEGVVPVRERVVNLVGIGLGNPETLTVEAVNAIERSELLIGARRMLEPYAARACEKRALIKPDDIVEALRDSDASCASVLFSGDVGFYSGATALSKKLAQLDGWNVRAIPGISSVVCLCARLLTPWQDVHLVSAHGRECDVAAEVRAHAKTFMLTGGKRKAADVCAELEAAGLGDVRVYVGERLSYADERITQGAACELAQDSFDDLAVMLVENPVAPKHEPGKLEG